MKPRKSVALQWDGETEAPLVVAKGQGELAERLMELARAYGVPVVDAPALADSLYVVDPVRAIPEPFYAAVAEIVGFVWRTVAGVDNKKVWDEEHQGQ